jgi:hypothetical protein
VARFGFLSGLYARSGGYASLAERFATSEPPPGLIFHGQTIMLDRTVAYKFCVTLGASPAGLYVHPQPKGLGSHPAVLIPWNEVERAERVRLYWRPGVRLTIGKPRIAELNLFEPLYEQLAAARVTSD